MASSPPIPQVEHLVQEIDRLIAEMARLRREVAALSKAPAQPDHSVREGEYFGMWADRPDMQGRASREWLQDLRAQHQTRSLLPQRSHKGSNSPRTTIATFE